MLRRAPLTLLLAASLIAACDDDEGTSNPADAAMGSGGSGGSDGGAPDAAAAGTSGADAAPRDSSAAGAGGDAAAGGAGGAMASAARGEYLVRTVLGCIDCHTPLGMDMRPDLTKALSGRLCFTDTLQMEMGRGCIHSANLTNHETGLKNLTDAEIRRIFTRGERGDSGKKLHSQMPYWQYALLSEPDAMSIVAYLRAVPGIDNRIPAHEAPHDTGASATITLLKDGDVPMVPGSAANADSARRGRYLAGLACMNCHTPSVMGAMPPTIPIDLTKAFAGGRAFGMNNFAANLTPHMTGIMGWTAMDIVKVLKDGLDKDGKKVCPPMPSGPMGLYKDLRNEDATDIANYLLGLPAQANMIPMNCAM